MSVLLVHEIPVQVRCEQCGKTPIDLLEEKQLENTVQDLQAAGFQVSPPDLRAAIESMKNAAREAIDSMHGLADVLSPRPPVLNRAGRRAAAKAARRKGR
jgi:hypothetical protein